MSKKTLTLTVHFQPRENSGPLTPAERKQLADFFAAVMDLRIQENIKKGNANDTHQ